MVLQIPRARANELRKDNVPLVRSARPGGTVRSRKLVCPAILISGVRSTMVAQSRQALPRELVSRAARVELGRFRQPDVLVLATLRSTALKSSRT